MKKSSKNCKKKTTPAKNVKPAKKVQSDLLNKDTAKATNPVALPDPIKQSRGGHRDPSEADAPGFKRVRGEFLSDTFKPRITLAPKSITFNKACVNLFPNCQHVSISIDETDLRLIVEPTVDYDKNSLKFANVKEGTNIPRTCTIKFFCQMLFDFMKWNYSAKYRILAIFHAFDNRKYILFNLDEALQVFSESEEAEDGKKKRKTTIQVPLEWKERFGYTMEELDEKTRIKFSNSLITIDDWVGEKKVGNIEPIPPTEEEVILRPYGGKRARKEATKDEEKKENE